MSLIDSLLGSFAESETVQTMARNAGVDVGEYLGGELLSAIPRPFRPALPPPPEEVEKAPEWAKPIVREFATGVIEGVDPSVQKAKRAATLFLVTITVVSFGLGLGAGWLMSRR